MSTRTSEITGATALDFTQDVVFRTIAELSPGANRFLQSGRLSDLPMNNADACVEMLKEMGQLFHACVAGIVRARRSEAIRAWDYRRVITRDMLTQNYTYLPFTNLSPVLTRYPESDDDYIVYRGSNPVTNSLAVSLVAGAGLLFTTAWAPDEEGDLFIPSREFREIFQIRAYLGETLTDGGLTANFRLLGQDLNGRLIYPYPNLAEQIIVHAPTLLRLGSSYTVTFEAVTGAPIVHFTAPVDPESAVTFYILAEAPQ